MQSRRSILGPVVQYGAAIHQGNEQFIWLLRPHRYRQWCLVRLLAMEVRIQSLRAHLRHLLHLSVVHVLEEAPQIRSCVQRLQLLLVQIQHLVDASLVLQLEVDKCDGGFQATFKIELLNTSLLGID